MEGIGVRWGTAGDEERVAELMESNGMPRALAYEERFVIAEEEGGEALAALGCETVSGRLLLGPLVVDPWARGYDALATALYAGSADLARGSGIAEVRVRPVPYGDGCYADGGDWRAGTALPFEVRGGLPAGGWRRVLALLGVSAVPFFRAFRP